ncbi:MAG: hypothetical protein NVS3B21_00970 [Acidimicrobiales bacterium]
MVGVVLTASTRHRTSYEVVIAVVLVVHAAIRTLVPLRWSRRWTAPAGVTAEALLCIAAVAGSGHWNSVFVFTLVTSVVAAGFAGGFALAVPLAIGIAALITTLSLPHPSGLVRLATAGTTELVLAAGVAAYGRQLFGEAERRASTVLDRLSGLTETNDLLQALNAVAQALPASLNLHDTVSEILGQLHSLFHGDASAVFLWDASLGHWSVAGAQGVRLPTALTEEEVPVPVRSASAGRLESSQAFLVDLSSAGPGMTPSSRVGLYSPLVARRSLVGVLAVEAQSPDGITSRDLELMSGVAEQAALAIDNAMWFGRLRTLGAEEERTRIARDLHDRVAQSLAYVAFELERIVDLSTTQAVTGELEELRHDVRRVVAEVRDTLYDLRTNVSAAQDLRETMDAFLERVRRRSGLEVQFVATVTKPLAVPLERELWRIGQEAIVNVERHAAASLLSVTWATSDDAAELTIVDNGRGFPLGTAGRFDSYGLLGMRERADAIGATLEIDTSPGAGTTIRCRVEVT